MKTSVFLRHDLPASLVVFLVALPLSLGIALASGAPILAGLIGGIVGGIVTGLLAGSPLQVSGPAAGLTVVVAAQVHQFGWQTACAITAAAGLLQLALGALRVARGTLMISPAVVHGMLAGIGISIALAQLHVALGGTPQSSPVKNVLALPKQLGALHVPALVLAALTFGILVLWKRVPKALQSVPGPLVAVGVGTLASLLPFAKGVGRIDLPDKFELTRLQAPPDWSTFAIAVLTVAVIASVESLLCAVATDKLHTGARANLDKELMAQGAGNVVSGLLGGLPITGVIVRSSANINAGAKTRWSAVLHGLWILLFALFLGKVIEQVPKAVLAGLLISVGVNLVNVHHIKELRHHKEVPIYGVTLAGVVLFNLLAGVGIGIALAVLFTLRRLAETQIRVEHRGEHWHARVAGALTFASVPELSAALARIPAGADVAIDLAVDFLDHAAFEALHVWRLNHEQTGGTVDIDESHEDWYQRARDNDPRGKRSVPNKKEPT